MRYRLKAPLFIGIAAGWVGLSAAVYTHHWIFEIPKRIRYEPYSSIVCLLVILSYFFSLRSRTGKWIAIENLLIFMMGMVYPFFLGIGLLRNTNSWMTKIGYREIILLISCGITCTWSSLFLISRNYLQSIRQRIAHKPGHDPVMAAGGIIPAGGILEFKATFGSMMGLTILCILLGLGLIILGIRGQSFLMAAIGCVFLIVLLVVRFRFKVTISNQKISSTGFFTRHTIHLADITNSYWQSYACVEIRTQDDFIRINFKLYPRECMAAVLEILEGPETSESDESNFPSGNK